MFTLNKYNSPGHFLLGVRTTSLIERFLQLYTVRGRGISSDALINSTSEPSPSFNGLPFAAIMKSKNDTSPVLYNRYTSIIHIRMSKTNGC